MSTYGQRYGLVGAVIGGIIGYFIPVIGWALGAYIGYVIGYYIGGYVDARKADIKVPGRPVDDLNIPSNVIGSPIYDGLGTVKVSSGQFLFYGRNRVVPVYQRVKVSSKKKKTVLVGYKYYMSWGIGILAGPVDCLYTIIKDQREVVWSGELVRPESGESTMIELKGMGKAQFFFGTGEQEPWPDVGKVIPDPNFNIPYRGLCWIYLQDCFLGERNRVPILSFVVRKTPPVSFSSNNVVAAFDYNPMSMIWYILHHLAGIPQNWLHSDDFSNVANTLSVEQRGLSVLFDAPQPAEYWLEAVNEHIDNILRYGSDGKFHPKLLRDDYNADELPEINESMLLEKPSINRKSWIDTVNEVKILYSYIPRGDYLIAWYRFNEGQGTIIPNRATSGALGGGPLPNLTIEGDVNAFWNTVPGFGYAPPEDGARAKAQFPKRQITTVSFGIFYRKTIPDDLYGASVVFCITADGDFQCGLMRVTLGGTTVASAAIGSSSAFSVWNDVKENWLFAFFDDSYRWNNVLPDGTLLVSYSPIAHEDRRPYNAEELIVGRTYIDFYRPADLVIGDIIVYNNKRIPIYTEGYGYKPWAQWYDELRSRYGMAPRNGW